jgi:hypothetical protein
VRLSQWLARMPSGLRALVILLAVFVPLALLFLATGEELGSAVAQAAFWAILAVFAAVVGRALGMRRRAQFGSGPDPRAPFDPDPDPRDPGGADHEETGGP